MGAGGVGVADATLAVERRVVPRAVADELDPLNAVINTPAARPGRPMSDQEDRFPA
jgi:hypothetical protein